VLRTVVVEAVPVVSASASRGMRIMRRRATKRWKNIENGDSGTEWVFSKERLLEFNRESVEQRQTPGERFARVDERRCDDGGGTQYAGLPLAWG